MDDLATSLEGGEVAGGAGPAPGPPEAADALVGARRNPAVVGGALGAIGALAVGLFRKARR